jgi:hypothetical protein
VLGRVLAVLVAFVSACASASAERPPPASEEPAEATPRPERRADESPSTDVAERAAKPSPEPPVASSAIDIGVWCADHGIQASLEVEQCYAAELGPHPGDSLWCLRHEELDDRRVAYFLALYGVQGKKLARLLEVPYAAGPRPMEGQEPSYYVKLSPVVAAGGAAFELSESPGPSCQDGTRRVREEFSYDPGLAKPIEQLVGRVCAARGKYAASGRRIK